MKRMARIAQPRQAERPEQRQLQLKCWRNLKISGPSSTAFLMNTYARRAHVLWSIRTGCLFISCPVLDALVLVMHQEGCAADCRLLPKQSLLVDKSHEWCTAPQNHVTLRLIGSFAAMESIFVSLVAFAFRSWRKELREVTTLSACVCACSS